MRTRKKTVARLSGEAARLVALARGLNISTNRTEDRYWENALEAKLHRLLEANNQATIENALDHLSDANAGAFDVLVELLEAQTESIQLDYQDQSWQVLLISIPLIAYSKFTIPCGVINGETIHTIAEHLRTQVLAKEVRLTMLGQLFSIDQLPKRFGELRQWTRKLGEAAISGEAAKLKLEHLPETIQIAADSRFIVGAIAAPMGAPLFRWQELERETHSGRISCYERWVQQTRACFAALMQGCVFECLLPDAYFANGRESDRLVRPYAIRGAVATLEVSLKISAERLSAVVAGFGEERVVEYRIAFLHPTDQSVLYGVVWPILEFAEDIAASSTLEHIMATLKEVNIQHVELPKTLYAMEYCEDCGAPLFADAQGEVVHPEMPEEVDLEVVRFH